MEYEMRLKDVEGSLSVAQSNQLITLKYITERDHNRNATLDGTLSALDSSPWDNSFDNVSTVRSAPPQVYSNISVQYRPLSASADSLCQDSSPDHSLADYEEDRASSSPSSEASPSSESDSEEGLSKGGVVYESFPSAEEINNNNNKQHSDSAFEKVFYDKPKFDIAVSENVISAMAVASPGKDLNIAVPKDMATEKENNNKMADAYLSGVRDTLTQCEEDNDNKQKEAAVLREKEKVQLMNLNAKARANPVSFTPLSSGNMVTTRSRRAQQHRKATNEILGSFDVYNIETAMPKIDLDAIEAHLKAARVEERRRRNDREEIRRRLATGCDAEDYYFGDRPGRKPSLQARLQSGMNLQICFMNETMSDTESPMSESAPPAKAESADLPIKLTPILDPQRTLNLSNKCGHMGAVNGDRDGPVNAADFFARQARLQADARAALGQAKDIARMQMEVERQRRQSSPITQMLRASLEKVGCPFPGCRRRVSRQMLTDMNVAQLQVVVNDLHSQIEHLNEDLVQFLLERDDLHMGQDSMLVDIEDLTRYLGAKENTLKEELKEEFVCNNNRIATTPKINRTFGLGKK